jgi:nucleoside-diphosphate-sugar epimerase
MKVLATGATGKYAHHVLAALTAQGVEVRGAVRDPDKADDARQAGAAETVGLDLTDTGEAPSGPDGLAVMFSDYDRVGFHGGNPLVLQAILQRPPRSVADFIAELGQARD